MYILFTLTLALSAGANPVARKCEDWLHALGQSRLERRPMTELERMFQWQRTNTEYVERGLHTPGEEARRAARVFTAVDQWAPEFRLALQKMGVWKANVDEVYGGEIVRGFEIDRAALLIHHPELESLLPVDYRLIFDPAARPVRGAEAWVTTGPERLFGLPIGVFRPALTEDTLSHLRHEGAHVELRRQREILRMPFYGLVLKTWGRMRNLIQLDGFSGSDFAVEEILAQAASGTDDLIRYCRNPRDRAANSRANRHLQRAFILARVHLTTLTPTLDSQAHGTLSFQTQTHATEVYFDELTARIPGVFTKLDRDSFLNLVHADLESILALDREVREMTAEMSYEEGGRRLPMVTKKSCARIDALLEALGPLGDYVRAL